MISNLNNKFLIILVVLIIADYSYSFYQYYNTTLDGDMANLIIPSESFQTVFDDPFGFQTILNDHPHSNPNRYFSHLMVRVYFTYIPNILNKFLPPITSVYLAVAIIKLLTQVLLVYFMAALMTGASYVLDRRMLLASILIIPLFQAYGFSPNMGIIDTAVSYVFFYALPFLLLTIYIYIFRIMKYDPGKARKPFLLICALILSVVLPLSGPLIAPTIVLSIAVYILYSIYIMRREGMRNFSVSIRRFFQMQPIPVTILAFLAVILSLSSVYLGTYNSDFAAESISFTERYRLLPHGLLSTFKYMGGFGYLFTILALNIIIILRYYKKSEGTEIIKKSYWSLLFIAVYILLLPLGGYREYRSTILRYDTILPITLTLVFIFGITTYFLITALEKRKLRRIYLTIVFAALVAYTVTDCEIKYTNDCERKSLEIIAASSSDTVALNEKCHVMSWYIITNPENSRLKGKLLYLWRITDKEKLYYYAKKDE